MSPAPQKRQPKGIPVGGEFAATAHSEAGIVLTRPGITEATYEASVERALSAAQAYEQTDPGDGGC